MMGRDDIGQNSYHFLNILVRRHAKDDPTQGVKLTIHRVYKYEQIVYGTMSTLVKVT